MSNSVFTDFSTQSRNDSSLVIVRNKDGAVSVDSAALRSYLKNETGNTSVSVIRVASPTPSLKEELEEEEEQELHANLENDDMDGDSPKSSLEQEAPHVRVTVEEFYTPDEAKRLRSEILQYAGMTSHLLLDIDNEERIKSIHNDHCYTPLTSPSQRHPASRAQTPPSAPAPAKEVVFKKKPESEHTDAGKAEESDQEGQSDVPTDSSFSESDFSVSESENDRDSDLDYTVNDRGTRRAKSKKNRGGASKAAATARGRVTRKQQSFSFEADGDTAEEEEPRSESGKKKPKPKLVKLTPIKGKKKEEPQVVKEEAKPIEVPQLVQQQQQKLQQQLVEKKKKAPAHVEALFSDMTSLFSTPDIIKKVDGNSKVDPPPLVYTTKTYGSKKETPLEDRDQLELIDSIVKQELEARAPIGTTQQMAEDIPSIVKMLENPESTIDPELLSDVIGLNTSQVATTTAPTSTQSATTELDLLEGLASEDGLPDELLQHVAELVENKNLQEVIDKQVLGVQTSMGTSVTTTLPVSTSTPKMEVKESPFVELAKQKQMAKEAAASIMSMNRKEPITIVRSDGRVITLPPIEAPTTRGAKRRAQSTASTPNTSVASSPTSTPQPPQQKSQRDSAEAIMPSLKRSTSKGDREASKSSSRRTSATPSMAESEENMDSDASWNSEDDPDRLWCICKQPHNNRFMICCDACEDWFHGKCVNITKAMGQQMEEQGIEWRCPNCLKKGPAAKKGSASNDDASSAAQSPTSSTSSLLSCIVCKKPSRPNSIYCSDDCIRKHAMVTTKSTAKESSAKPPGPPGATKKVGVLKNKFDRVIVYNKVTGKCLSGESAPTLTNLKHWLSENPNYEVVQPGSALGQAFKAKQAQLATISKQMALKRQQQMEKETQGKEKVQTQLKVTSNKQIVVMHPSGKNLSEGKASPKSTKPPQASTSGGQKTTPKQTTLPVVKTKKSPAAAADPPKSSPRGEPEPIRVNVRRTLKEQLTSRIADTRDVQGKLTAEEVAKFATEVEYEMFTLFNKDTGTKYRAKYRSLMFNIKDRKNMSLLEKICEKFILPGQLVRMAPEELASQELAQWRENENKHQLEMIKKSELDLLACAKNYVLKTHKGEEVIEGRISERVSLDPSIAVEDVVSVLNNSTVTSSSEPEGGVAKDKSLAKGEKGKDAVSSSKSGHSSSKKKDRDRRSRSRDRHGKSSKHKRKRSRERRSRSKEDRHREGKREERKDREKSGRDRDRSRDKKNVSSSTKKVSSDVKAPVKEIKSTVSERVDESYNLIDKILKASEIIDKTAEEVKEVKDATVESKSQVSESIPEPPKKSMSVESDQEPSSTITIPTPPETTFDNEEEEEEPQEYTPPPSIWTGSINMVDVATFQISAFSVSGGCEAIGKELPAALDIVGRISPDTVWEYISKIKKSGNKEILILQFKAETESEQTKYSALYTYLDSRKRLGVVKTASTSIKDFYISPLAAHKSLPTVLLPIKGVGFEDNRPDLLLGVLVMIKSGVKRVSTTLVSKHGKRAALAAAAAKGSSDSHTPPMSPKAQISLKSKGLQDSRKKLMMMMPKQSKEKISSKIPKATPPAKVEPNPDDDEPYSPGGSDDDIPMIPSSTSAAAPAVISNLDPDDIQRKMEELNRQIGAKKMEIAGILNKGQDTVNDEPYSPSGPVTPPAIPAIPAAIPSLANISIPSNLSEILASIKNVSGAGTSTAVSSAVGGSKAIDSIEPEDDDEEYTPIAPITGGSFQGVDYKPTGYKPAATVESSGPSKLAQLSEEELLSMVPDDAILEDIKASKAEEAAEGTKDDEAYEPASKKSKWDDKEKSTEPPPPGLEDEYEPE